MNFGTALIKLVNEGRVPILKSVKVWSLTIPRRTPLYFPSDTNSIFFVIASHIKPNSCIVPQELFHPIQPCPYSKQNVIFFVVSQNVVRNVQKKVGGQGLFGQCPNLGRFFLHLGLPYMITFNKVQCIPSPPELIAKDDIAHFPV